MVIDARFEHLKKPDGNEEDDPSHLINHTSPFMFMMSLLDQLNADHFQESDPTLIASILYTTSNVYDNFKLASRYREKPNSIDDQFGLIRYFK